MASENQAEKNEQPATPGAQPTSVPPWKILIGIGILLALMIVGGFVLK